ncbi:TMEM175 family protein [Streptomyces pathocidini]|uniref:TMEM175 family protein n=1 Tax=Streptomyces pathocidini TaxID=1650571 RepID=UPI0033D4BB61
MDRGPTAAPGAGEGAGEGIERLSALSDGVFAIAMTLLVLDVSISPNLDAAAFERALEDLLPNLAAYALSFVVIAQFWTDHRRILGAAPKADGPIVALTLLGLGLIALLPFPTSLLAEYGGESLAVAIYSGVVGATNAAHLALTLAVNRRLRPTADPLARRAQRLDAADLAATVLVFALAIPLAFVSPDGAKWFWLTLLPIKVALGRRQHAATRTT